MAQRRRRFSLADFGIQMPDTMGLSGLGDATPRLAIDPLELINIFAPRSGQEEAETVIDDFQGSDGGQLIASAAGALPSNGQLEKKPSAPTAQTEGQLQQPQQPQQSQQVQPIQNPQSIFTAEDSARRDKLQRRLGSVRKAAEGGGVGGIFGLIGALTSGKARRELEELNTKAFLAEEAEKNFNFQQKSVQLEDAKSRAQINKNLAIQSNQANTYEELNTANTLNQMKDWPEEVVDEKLKMIGTKRNADGTIPLWRDDFAGRFSKEKLAEWTMADEEFRAGLNQIATIDPELRKPFFDSFARAKKRAIEIATAKTNLSRAKVLLDTARKGDILQDAKDMNTLINSYVDNARGENQSIPVSDEFRDQVNAGIKEQGKLILESADKAGIKLMDSTRRVLGDTEIPPGEPTYETFDLFSIGQNQSRYPAIPMRLTPEQEEYDAMVQSAVVDVKTQMEQKIKSAGPVDQRDGNVVRQKDPKKKPVVSGDDKAPPTPKSRQALLKEKRELERRKRRK